MSEPASLTLQVQPAGQTSLTGQVLDETGAPVQGAIITRGTLQTTTDAAGNFLLANPPVGANQLLLIDGSPASAPGRSLPVIPYKVTIFAGQANALGFTSYLHFQKTTGLVDISNSSVQRVVTQPDIPGFEMRIPAGVTITGWDGQPNTQVSIRRVATDRTPIPPLPDGLYSPSGYMYYFGKQGGGTPSAPIPITVPNDLDVPPGTQVQLWFYDEAPDGSRPNQMAQFGTGTVSADGSQIVPDIDPSTGKPFGQPRFCCGWLRVAIGQAIRAQIQALLGTGVAEAAEAPSGGDPVNLNTGTFSLQKTDLVLAGRLPVVVTRSYRSQGPPVGPFGFGTSHTYQVLLLIQSNLRTLGLPSGAQLAFPRQAGGTFQNFTDPSVRGAVLTASGSNHILRFKDGTTWTFGAPVTGAGGVTGAFLVAQTDRNGNILTLTRSGATQNLTAITEPAGRQLTLTYDGSNRITTITDPIGRTVAYTYGGGGLASVTDPAGGVTRYTYDAQNRMTSITDPRGITFLTNEYDVNGRVARQTQADGGVWQFAYTVTAGVVTQTVVTDPRGNPTTSRFNGQGYLLRQTDALGQTTTYTRDPATNLLLSVIDPLGRAVSFAYDATGNITRITDPGGGSTEYAYEATFNEPIRVTNALGQSAAATYDAAGNLTAVTDPQGRVTTFGYDPQGALAAVTDPAGRQNTFAYSAQGDIVALTNPLGTRITQTFDLASRLVEAADGNGQVAGYTYDPLNRPLSVVGPLGNTVTLAYDPAGNAVEVVDARGQRTQFEYNAMGQIAARIDPAGARETFAYDAAGNLLTVINRRGQALTFEYDPLDRPRRTVFADGTSIDYVYDAADNLLEARDSAAGTITRTYDVLGQLLTETSAQGNLSYAYDVLGRRTQMLVSGEAPVTYRYDPRGELAQIQQGTLQVGVQYDALGRRTQLALPNGVTTAYQYDTASNLTALTHQLPTGTFQDLRFTYDGRGGRIGVSGRAAGFLLPDPVAVPPANSLNQYTAFGAQALTYDEEGNLTSLTDVTGTTTFTWNARGQLVAASGSEIAATFAYDALGRRVRKMVNGVTREFTYDGIDIIREVREGIPVSYLRGLNLDEVWARSEEGETQFYLTDELGSTSALVDTAGTVRTQYAYGPFGVTRTVGSPSANPFQFTGVSGHPIVSHRGRGSGATQGHPYGAT